MILASINELSVFDVFGRGQPNREHIAIRVEEPINLGQYGIMIGLLGEDGTAIPYLDNLFWFGNGVVKKGDWLFVYTGSGEAKNTKTHDGTSDVFTLYWGKPTTAFARTNVVPVLFRTDSVSITYPKGDLPQLDAPLSK